MGRLQNHDAKTVMDKINPKFFSNLMPRFLIPTYTNTNSLSEEIEKGLLKATVVKRHILDNSEVMLNSKKSDGGPIIFVTGSSLTAKAETIEILKALGGNNIIDPADITTSRGTEMMLPVGDRTYMATGNGHIAFKIIR